MRFKDTPSHDDILNQQLRGASSSEETMITIMTTARLRTITDVGAEYRFEKIEGIY